MPWREDILVPLEDWGPERHRVRMRLNTERGVLADFVVQYEMRQSGEDEFAVVVRYDGSHGHAHRDVLDEAGKTVRKTWLPDHLTSNDALQRALDDIRENWRRYRDDFLWRRR